jgi:hypothetical protein
MASLHKIALVFDPSFGGRLSPLAQRLHVWIIRSPINELAVQEYARNAKADDDEDALSSGVTMFDHGQLDGRLLESVWDHHGEFSHEPPLSEIHVIGTRPTKSALDALAGFGFKVDAEQSDGFIAVADEPTGQP